jgi:SAM-dependent methyltransferase
MKTPEYQHELSRQSPILLDTAYKKPKIEKMLAILEDAGAVSTQGEKRLMVDVGCSGGLFAHAFSPYFQNVIGIDIDTHALAIARKERAGDNITYMVGDSLRLPLPDNSVDLIVCNHVYEHVPSAALMFDEIARVLAADGVCYLGAASRLTFIEPHYHLPFLSWLPKPLAHLYMRVTGKGRYYYENLQTFWGIRRLIHAFNVTDYTLRIIRDPDHFKARDMIPSGGFIEKIPPVFWKLAYWLLPSYIFILRKRAA